MWGENGALLSIVGYEERQWRHLDMMQLEKVLQARVPPVPYPDWSTRMVRVPWIEIESRWTLVFEAQAIEMLRACGSLNEGA